ncbi:orotidine-5'-phosphate decarboxylase [Rhodobacteraceae bacterium CCMM004]|nr:orotidine-5'-phosphate decarboxylase [Rhodobacteraceae bacterium CCMM004]
MPDSRLIVALDFPDALTGLTFARSLGPRVSFFKIGLEMLTGGGLALADELKQQQGKRIFLDLKLFDIPNTVRQAVRGLARYNVDFLTVHGDPYVVEAAREGVEGTDTRILGVAVMTSLDRADLDAAMIVPGDVAEITLERAARAFAAGAHGVIVSPHEAAAIRGLPEAEGRLIVTPGVRPEGSPAHDQKRVMTPSDAIAAGADHIVVGRPIRTAPDPRATAEAILSSLP